MDVGFHNAGFDVIMACDLDKHACDTYNRNAHLNGHAGEPVYPMSVRDLPDDLPDVDVIFGGPPCQGYSVAGKMDPDDERSTLIFDFFDIIMKVKPKGFVCENVPALATSAKWAGVRDRIGDIISDGYLVSTLVLNARDYGVPQSRERMFMLGVRRDLVKDEDVTTGLMNEALAQQKKSPPTLRSLLVSLGKVGSGENPDTCKAKVTFAKNPVLRKSPYAGMLFNGGGRPLDPSKTSSTLPASMGGNRTPIIDELNLDDEADSFIQDYHTLLMAGHEPAEGEAPDRLRRLTIKECQAIQSFPEGYEFCGPVSSAYRQIGNAVPCLLAEAVANAIKTGITNTD